MPLKIFIEIVLKESYSPSFSSFSCSGQVRLYQVDRAFEDDFDDGDDGCNIACCPERKSFLLFYTKLHDIGLKSQAKLYLFLGNGGVTV